MQDAFDFVDHYFGVSARVCAVDVQILDSATGVLYVTRGRETVDVVDPVQAVIFKYMPIFFTFLLASFPAGLVIYWAWNNFLSVLQQGYIMRKNGVPIELLQNLGIGKKASSEK